MSETQAPYELKIEDKRFKESPSLPATTDSNAVLIMAMQKGYTPDLIKQMMDLSERHEANEARKAYFAALAEFKENLPTIKKNKAATAMMKFTSENKLRQVMALLSWGGYVSRNINALLSHNLNSFGCGASGS